MRLGTLEMGETFGQNDIRTTIYKHNFGFLDNYI